ncbi:hypothetical protein [Nonomuraea soli]|uniref:SAF domain-containing protein n=1 Tax=Nonomuraea soli TaxID=1032476 RepID=A0A7W0CJW5_9ACTN|nr:hypothetical protein [Nonomuraea soli]MBA2892513.1 hypothetical protein [Nonomuraea soli]
MKATEQSFRRPEAQRLADQGVPSQPAPSRRLPSAPRERKPALAALAVLLIVGGALLTAYLVLQMGNRVPVLKLARDVPAGQKFQQGDFVEVDVPKDMDVQYIPAGQIDLAQQKYARFGIPAGTLLTEALTMDSPEGLVAGKAVVGLSLKAGQVPAMINAGQRVQVIYVSGDEGTAGTGKVLADRALVQSVTSPESGNVLVDVVIDKAAAANVSAAASAGRITLAYLPGGTGSQGQPAVTPTPQPSDSSTEDPIEPTTKPSKEPTKQSTKPTASPSATESG